MTSQGTCLTAQFWKTLPVKQRGILALSLLFGVLVEATKLLEVSPTVKMGHVFLSVLLGEL